jgi:hypothetical protein
VPGAFKIPVNIGEHLGWHTFFPDSNCRPLERNSEQHATA